MDLFPIFFLTLTVVVGFTQSSSLNTPLHTQNDNLHAVKNPAQVLSSLNNGKQGSRLPFINAEQLPLTNTKQVLTSHNNAKQGPKLPLTNAEQTLASHNNGKQALVAPPIHNNAKQALESHNNGKEATAPPPIHCIDENNNVVDWVILVKLPRTRFSPNPLIVNGEAYLTVSSEDVKRYEQRQQNQARKNQSGQKNQAKTFEQRKTSTNNNENGKNIAESIEKTIAHTGQDEKRKKNNHARKNPPVENDGHKNVKHKHGKNVGSGGHVEKGNRKDKKGQNKNKHSHVHGKRQNERKNTNLNHRQEKQRPPKHSGDRKLSTPLIPNPLINQLDAFEADLKEHQIEHMKKVSHNNNNTRLPESENSKLNNVQNSSSWFETSLFNALKQKINDNSLEEKDIQLLFHDENKSERRNVRRRDVNNAFDTMVGRKLDLWNVENGGKQTIPVSEFESLMKSADQKPAVVYLNEDGDYEEVEHIKKAKSAGQIPALVSQRPRVSFNDDLTDDDFVKSDFVGLNHIRGPQTDLVRKEWSDIWESVLMMKKVRALNVLNDIEYVVHAHNMLHGQNEEETNIDYDEEEEVEPSNEEPKLSKEGLKSPKEDPKPFKETLKSAKQDPKPLKQSVESESESVEKASLEEDSILEEDEEEEVKEALLQWTLSKHSIRDVSSLPGRLLSPYLFNSSYSPLFTQDGVKILYNDQTPGNKTTFLYGHSKGLLVGNSQGGIWVVHSVPHFVDDSQAEYSYPHTGLMYGQNFLCLTLNASALDSVGSNLGVNQIYKYSTFMSESVQSLYPTLAKVIDGSFAPPEQNFLVNEFSTSFAKHEAFHSFAKTKQLGKDLYQVVGDQLGVSLLVETWPNGPGRLRSDCKNTAKHFVENVVRIGAAGVVSYFSTHDHAKWAISFGNETSSTGKSFGFGPKAKTEKASLLSRTGKSLGFEHVTNTKETRKAVGLGNENQTRTQEEQKDSKFEQALYAKANALDGSFESVFKRIEDLAALDSDDNNWRVNVNENNVDLNNEEKEKEKGDDNVNFAANHRCSDDENPNHKCANAVDEVDENIERVNDNANVDLTIDDNSPNHDSIVGLAWRDTGVEATDIVTAYHGSPNHDSFDTLENNIEETLEDGRDVEKVNYWVCNGDINRAEEQKKRGGGTVCMNNKAVWILYQGLIYGIELCPLQ